MAMRPTDGFEEWVGGARQRLVRSAARLLGDEAEAENVVQATLVAVWEAHRAGDAQSLDAYARRAVWLNALRLRSRRRETEPLDAAAGEHAGDPEGDLAPWELERAIEELPAAQQAVIRLRFYGGLSFHEIGTTLAISINTAMSRCRYALAALRETFEDEEEAP